MKGHADARVPVLGEYSLSLSFTSAGSHANDTFLVFLKVRDWSILTHRSTCLASLYITLYQDTRRETLETGIQSMGYLSHDVFRHVEMFLSIQCVNYDHLTAILEHQL